MHALPPPRPDPDRRASRIETEARTLVETTRLPMRVIAARVGVARSTLSKLRTRRGWRRPGPARVAAEGRHGGGHPIVPQVVEEARALLAQARPDGSRLSFADVAARTGVSRTTLFRWCMRGLWRRPPLPQTDRPVPVRYRRGRGRPYAADAVGTARRLVTTSLMSQKAIARQIGISQAQVSAWMRSRGWTRPEGRPGSKRFAASARGGPLVEAGDRRGRPYTAEIRREARALYEVTRLPTGFIGERLGVHRVTVARWAKEESWERPRGRIGAKQLRGYFGLLKRGGG